MLRADVELVENQDGTDNWWPNAPNDDVRARLFRRLLWYGWLMPNYTILCITLLLMHMHPPSIPPTEDSPQRIKKLGLHYKGIPIVDFGIAKGSIKVPPGSRFAFWPTPVDRGTLNELIRSGQVPETHYWMYFTTILGRELILDCGLYTYGLGLTLNTAFLPQGIFDPVGLTPAYFVEEHVAVVDNQIRTTTQRFSVLQDHSLAELSPVGPHGMSSGDQEIVLRFMEKVKGGEVTTDETRWS